MVNKKRGENPEEGGRWQLSRYPKVYGILRKERDREFSILKDLNLR